VARAEAHLAAMTDAALRREATSLRTRAEGGEPVDVVTVAGFAQVREVARRVLGQRPFDVQILGGLALFDGFVVEMQTGEGKTLAAVAPAVVHALLKRSVHILTFNDYLARRDAEWMGDIYRYFGLRVAFVQEGMSSSERRRPTAPTSPTQRQRKRGSISCATDWSSTRRRLSTDGLT
jgi:preprotein translocase subunit SecA